MLLVALLCTDASLANMLLDTDCRRRRIHACHMRRRIHVARHRLQHHEGAVPRGQCSSHEDTCMAYEEEDRCRMRRRRTHDLEYKEALLPPLAKKRVRTALLVDVC